MHEEVNQIRLFITVSFSCGAAVVFKKPLKACGILIPLFLCGNINLLCKPSREVTEVIHGNSKRAVLTN